MSEKAPLKIFSGTNSKYLAEQIAKKFGQNLGKYTLNKFSDGEFQPSFEESVRGCRVFIVQSTHPPCDNLFELLLMIDAAKRASAYKIIAVMPYFGYARQDRKDKPRVSIGAKMVTDLLSAAGVSRVMTMDLHADQIQGFFDVPVDHLYASSIFVPHIKNMNLDNLVIAAPDMGGTKRANAYSRFLNCDMVICYKLRKKANYVDEITIIGEVKDKNVVIIDDMIDTAGTMVLASDLMKSKGARSVRAVATHPVLSGKAVERIDNSSLSEVIVSDTIPITKKSDKIKILPVAGLFATVISKVYNYQSISSTFLE